MRGASRSEVHAVYAGMWGGDRVQHCTGLGSVVMKPRKCFYELCFNVTAGLGTLGHCTISDMITCQLTTSH